MLVRELQIDILTWVGKCIYKNAWQKTIAFFVLYSIVYTPPYMQLHAMKQKKYEEKRLHNGDNDKELFIIIAA